MCFINAMSNYINSDESKWQCLGESLFHRLCFSCNRFTGSKLNILSIDHWIASIESKNHANYSKFTRDSLHLIIVVIVVVVAFFFLSFSILNLPLSHSHSFIYLLLWFFFFLFCYSPICDVSAVSSAFSFPWFICEIFQCFPFQWSLESLWHLIKAFKYATLYKCTDTHIHVMDHIYISIRIFIVFR